MRSFKQLILIRLAYIVVDVVLITSAFYLACLFRAQTLPFTLNWHQFFFSDLNPYRALFLLWLLTTLFFNQIHGLYQTRREMLETFEIVDVIKSVALSSLVFIVLVYLWKIPDFPRSVLMVSIILMTFFLSMWRIFKKFSVEYLVANGYNNFNVLIIGAGKVGMSLEKEIKRRPGMGLKMAGFLDDHQVGIPHQGRGVVLGKINDFAAIAQREFINEVFITIHHDSDVFMRILEQARMMKIAVRVVPQGYEMSADVLRYNIGIIPILAYSDVEINYRHRVKRLFDLIMAWGGFLVVSPLWLTIMVLIKMDSKGPIFYSSHRYGQGGRIFKMLKFRSMTSNAEELLAQLKQHNEVDGPIFKMKQDPRVTKVGVWLRKYSLDELPQLINVINGDMSLVGPRPLPIDQVEKEDLRQLKRLDIRPGITGLWQIRGRSDVSFDRLVKWDIWYINNWSFALDLYILFQTIPVVLKAKGAY